MKKNLKHIMLIDDDEDDNYFHERAIKMNNPDNIVIVENSGTKALTYLKSAGKEKSPHPDLIFLDVNMPRMNGWEFLSEYNLLDEDLQSEVVIIMLSTSQSPEDKAQANSWKFVYDYISKPLTSDMMQNIVDKYFASV